MARDGDEDTPIVLIRNNDCGDFDGPFRTLNNEQKERGEPREEGERGDFEAMYSVNNELVNAEVERFNSFLNPEVTQLRNTEICAELMSDTAIETPKKNEALKMKPSLEMEAGTSDVSLDGLPVADVVVCYVGPDGKMVGAVRRKREIEDLENIDSESTGDLVNCLSEEDPSFEDLLTITEVDEESIRNDPIYAPLNARFSRASEFVTRAFYYGMPGCLSVDQLLLPLDYSFPRSLNQEGMSIFNENDITRPIDSSSEEIDTEVPEFGRSKVCTEEQLQTEIINKNIVSPESPQHIWKRIWSWLLNLFWPIL